MGVPCRIASLWALAFCWAQAGQGVLSDGHLDTAAVRDAYLRADMAFVRGALEGFIKVHPRDVHPAEKIFTHLYLGASYSADSAGRALAEAHFKAALRLDPDADPAGLYLAPAVKGWFEGLRAGARIGVEAGARGAESDRNRTVGTMGAATRSVIATENPATMKGSEEPARGRGWLWWTLGGTAAAAALGAGTFGWIQAESHPQPRRVRVDATLK